MSPRFLLDTSVVSSPISTKPNVEIVRRIRARGHECVIAAPVWHELTCGYRRMPPGKHRIKVEAYVRGVIGPSFPIIPYDEAAAEWHGAERARLEALGRPPPYADGQIAAIAKVNELVLVTTNTKDFSRFKELQVEDWSRATR